MDLISNELEDVCFGDLRINKRAKKIIEAIYKSVGDGLSSSFGGSSELNAAYRFFDNNQVNEQKILEPHYKKSIERIKQHKVVGLMQDTTDTDMKHMKSVNGLGVLNDTKRPGCSLHPVIAFTPDKLCLGIVNAKFVKRFANELGKKTHQNLRKIEDKESYRWIEGYKIACKVADECKETLCVSIGDRESDIFELFLEATKEENKAKLIARAWHNRTVETPRSEENEILIQENKRLKDENKILSKENKNKKSKNIEENKKIIEENNKIIKENIQYIKEDELIIKTSKYQLHNEKPLGTINFTLPEGRGRKSREVSQNIRVKKLTLVPSVHKKDLPSVTINAVLLEEFNTPVGETAISWMFLTTLPIDTIEQIQLIIELYLARWGIEMFFKVLKSGCKIEELRFEEASRLLACISLYMIVAWRVLYASFIGRACPNLPCSVLFGVDEWQSVYAVVVKKKPPEEPPKLKEFMKMVATLGGHQGRKSDGPPGMTVIWRGLQSLYKLTIGWRAHKEFA
jgi:hypothetical protein